MSSAVPLVLDPDAGEFLWFGAGLFTFKVTSGQSGGAFILIEDMMSRGKTTPLHMHPGHDETVYLIEGEVLVHMDGVEQIARSGSVAAIPRGTPHAFHVISESARLIAFVTPGDRNAEAFFRQGGEPAPSRTAPPPGTPLQIERLLEAGRSTGFMKVLGPPPFKRDAESSAQPNLAG
jgi:quercetin dioxygenase-like cupin family protein